MCRTNPYWQKTEKPERLPTPGPSRRRPRAAAYRRTGRARPSREGRRGRAARPWETWWGRPCDLHKQPCTNTLLLPPFRTPAGAFSFSQSFLQMDKGLESCWNSLVQDDVALQSSQQLPGSSSVEVQRRQRVTSPARQHQEVPA